MLTREEHEYLLKITASNRVQNLELLEQFIWQNTTTSKYRIGEYFNIDDNNYMYYGTPLHRMNAMVLEVIPQPDIRQFMYCMEMRVVHPDGGIETIYTYLTENELSKFPRTINNLNVHWKEVKR